MPDDTKITQFPHLQQGKFPMPGVLKPAPNAVFVKADCEPMEFLLQVMHDKNQHMERRLEAAKALLPFRHSIKPIKRR
jgi:hypothetical protein